MTRELKSVTERRAKSYGFSSLQEFVRFMLSRFNEGQFRPAVINTDDFITSEAVERLNRYSRELDKDIEANKAYIANTAEELLDQLNSFDE